MVTRFTRASFSDGRRMVVDQTMINSKNAEVPALSAWSQKQARAGSLAENPDRYDRIRNACKRYTYAAEKAIAP